MVIIIPKHHKSLKWDGQPPDKMHFNTHDSSYVVKVSQTDVITTYRALELFGTFFPSSEKTPVGDKHVSIRLAVILHLYSVAIIHLQIILSYKVHAQQIALPIPIQTQYLEYFYQLSKMFHNQRVSLKNYSIAFGGGYRI